MQDLEQTIRERAYQIWIETGHQNGHAEVHWLAAQREILSASIDEPARASVSPNPSIGRKRRKDSRKSRAA
jgi:Protein of unknown function (DUF2934)